MIPFNLQRAKNGQRIITRSGKSVRFIAVLGDKRIPAPLVVQVLSFVGSTESPMESYFLNGRYNQVHETEMDLFLDEIA